MSNYVYYKDTSDGHVYGYDASEESQLPYIEKAKAAGWQDVTSSWPPAPVPADKSLETIGKASSLLQSVAYLTSAEMQTHITQASRDEVSAFIKDVSNILAAAQSAYAAGQSYSPPFPPVPTVIPVSGELGATTAFIQFVEVA